jgi:hypothetical protein
MECLGKPVIGVDGFSFGVGKIRSVEVIAGVNLLAYVVLLIAFLGMESFFSFGLFLLHLGVLYSIVGIICSYGLHRHRKWSWYLAIIMWIGEGILASWVAYVNGTQFSNPSQGALGFLPIAIFRLASVAYFVTSKVTKNFEVGKHIVDDDL